MLVVSVRLFGGGFWQFLLTCIFCYSLLLPNALALTFQLPSQQESVVGELQWIHASPGDTFNSIGRRHDTGYAELVAANPGIAPNKLMPGTIIIIPTRFILPA